jgi:tetratricopeptide (TPR) repeat protein
LLAEMVRAVDRLPPELGARVLIEHGSYLQRRHSLDESFEAGARALALAPADSAEAGYANLHCGRIHMARFDVDQSMDSLERAKAIFESLDLAADLGTTVGLLGTALHYCGRDDEAADQLLASERMLAEVGDHLRRATVLEHLASVRLRCGDADEAIKCYRVCLDVHHTLGRPLGVALTELNIALALLHLGRLEEAYRHATTAADLYTQVEDRRFQGFNYLNLAAIQLHRGRIEGAREAAWSSIEIARELGDVAHEQQGHAQLALVSIETGAFEEAEALLGVALALGTAGRPEQSAELYCWWGALRALSGDPQGAQERLAEAEAFFARAPSRCLQDLLPICKRLVAWKRGEVPSGVFRDELILAGSSTIAEVRLAARWLQRELSRPEASP